MSETTNLLQQQFDRLSATREEILARSMPLREERDAIKNEARAKENSLNARIKEIEAGLAQIDTDLGCLARALGGRSMGNTGSAR
jgi:hypothetical protein